MYDDDEKPSTSSSSSLPMFSSAAQTALKPGTHTVEEYFVNDDKKKVKVVRKVKVVTKQVKVNKNVVRRRALPKFGDAKSAPAGPEENVTYLSNELISLDLRPKRREEKEDGGPLNLDKLQQSRCRNCGEIGHWTLKCPKRAEIKLGGAAGEREEAFEANAAAAGSGAGGRYVPPAARNRGVRGLGGPGAERDRDDNLSVRVTNLSEDTTEADVRELFERIGRVSRIFLAKDRVTGLSRGFAFVSFYERRAAEDAIGKLNGHGYDNLILHVEWAKPREPDANRERDGASVMGGPRG